MVGKLGLNGFMAGDAAVVLRFKEVIPDSKPVRNRKLRTKIPLPKMSPKSNFPLKNATSVMSSL